GTGRWHRTATLRVRRTAQADAAAVDLPLDVVAAHNVASRVAGHVADVPTAALDRRPRRTATNRDAGKPGVELDDVVRHRVPGRVAQVDPTRRVAQRTKGRDVRADEVVIDAV